MELQLQLDPEGLLWSMEALQHAVELALESADGDLLCKALLQIVAVLPSPSPLSPEKLAKCIHRSWRGIYQRCVGAMFGQASPKLREVQKHRMRSLVILCMERLDFDSKGVWKRTVPVMRHLAIMLRRRGAFDSLSTKATFDGCGPRCANMVPC